jgi:hypothetical protein
LDGSSITTFKVFIVINCVSNNYCFKLHVFPNTCQILVIWPYVHKQNQPPYI